MVAKMVRNYIAPLPLPFIFFLLNSFVFSTWVILHYTNLLVIHFRMNPKIVPKSNSFYYDHQRSSSRLGKNLPFVCATEKNQVTYVFEITYGYLNTVNLT